MAVSKVSLYWKHTKKFFIKDFLNDNIYKGDAGISQLCWFFFIGFLSMFLMFVALLHSAFLCYVVGTVTVVATSGVIVYCMCAVPYRYVCDKVEEEFLDLESQQKDK